MRYDNETMLPDDAFKTDPLGRIKLHGGGGGGGGGSYDPTKDKQYKQQQKYLDTLKADIAKNNQKMTTEEIMAALSPTQLSVIGNQMSEQQPIPQNTWNNFNPVAQPMQPQTFTPQAQMQPSGQFGYDQRMLEQLQALLANSSLLPSATASQSMNSGRIGGQ
jgi:hypothetical protein